MKLTQTEKSDAFPIVRYTSENNLWEVGIYPVLFGVRVGANPVGDFCYAIEYCAGDNPGFAFALLITVIKILESLPETVSACDVRDLFPSYALRLVDRDNCWKTLLKMAGNVESQPKIPQQNGNGD